MIYVDANYWIYWFDQRLPEHEHVLKPMRSAVNEGLILNYITLIEVGHYMRQLDEKEFDEKMDRIRRLSTLTLVDLDISIADLAVKMLKKYAPLGIGGRDSVILATMQANNVTRILTHDEAFERVKGIKAIDPIPR